MDSASPIEMTPIAVRRWRRLFIVLGVVAVAAWAISFTLDEPIRRRLEAQMNANLVGYKAKIRAVRFHPFGFAITLKDTVITQDKHPKPPVADFPRLDASVHWRALLSLRLVADFIFDRPKIHVDRTHVVAEANDPVPVEERGWQRALESIYPLKINQFVVRSGEITYVEDKKSKPIRIDELQVRATNIRNVRSRERTYPSDLTVRARVLDTGRLKVDGHADFLAEPYAGVKVAVDLADAGIDRFRPVLERYNLTIAKGRLSVAGDVEFSPKVKTADVRTVSFRDLDVAYLNRPAHAADAERLREETAEAAREVSNEPGVLIKVDEVIATPVRLRYVNEQTDPPYALEISDGRLRVTNLSNHSKRGPAAGELAGRFMGSGPARATFAFRPEKNGPDFDLAVQIDDTDLMALNDLFRAYGDFDVAAGRFSFYTELKVHDGRIDGYLKPLFADMKVYDRRQDAHEGVLHQVYEGLVGGVAKLLENPPRDSVATKATISGPVDDAKLNTLQVILRLIQNAFFRAILPGFEEKARESA